MPQCSFAQLHAVLLFADTRIDLQLDRRMRFKPWPRSTGMPWIRRGMTITSVINCAHSRGRTFAIRAHLSAACEKFVRRTICTRTAILMNFVSRTWHIYVHTKKYKYTEKSENFSKESLFPLKKCFFLFFAKKH